MTTRRDRADEGFRAKRHALRLRALKEFDLNVFSALCRSDLALLLRNKAKVQLLEIECVIGNFVDATDHQKLTEAVAEILKMRGVKQPPGRRTKRPALFSMSERLVTALVDYGTPFRTGDNSRMVRVLRRIEAELQLGGDPRDVLRKLAREQRKSARTAALLFIEAALAGARPDAEVNGLPE